MVCFLNAIINKETVCFNVQTLILQHKVEHNLRIPCAVSESEILTKLEENIVLTIFCIELIPTTHMYL
jgi:hypothetical protein